jgi:ketosteroid isomerase-like protein
MSMTDGEIRALCNRFFDAYQDRRVDELAEIYAPACVVWHNVYGGREMSGADNLAALPKSYEMQRRRTYNDRTINTFAGGFVIQYTLHGVQHSGTVRQDWNLLELCDRFFDAIEQKDYATLERCYAPEAVVWHSHDCLYQPRDANLAMLKDGMQRLKKMRFKNRRVHTFEGGFVQQHTLYVTHPNDFVGQMDVCFVGYVRDGMISRAYEYFDTGQMDKFLPPRNASATS